MFKIIDFMGQILSFPTYNGSPVVQVGVQQIQCCVIKYGENEVEK
jgi:hypothetical protein